MAKRFNADRRDEFDLDLVRKNTFADVPAGELRVDPACTNIARLLFAHGLDDDSMVGVP
jgi:hypothetical protein